jgi:hypothetical protein
VSEDGDWAAVAKVVSERMDGLGLSRQGLAKRAKLSTATVRLIQLNYGKHRHKPETLEMLSVALEFPPGYLGNVLHGRSQPEVSDAEQVSTEVLMRRLGQLDKISVLEEHLKSLVSEVAIINEKLDRLTVDVQHPGPGQ